MEGSVPEVKEENSEVEPIIVSQVAPQPKIIAYFPFYCWTPTTEYTSTVMF